MEQSGPWQQVFLLLTWACWLRVNGVAEGCGPWGECEVQYTEMVWICEENERQRVHKDCMSEVEGTGVKGRPLVKWES